MFQRSLAFSNRQASSAFISRITFSTTITPEY